MVIIPFSGPGIQARTTEQQRAFSSLKSLKSEVASSIGYVVALGKLYRDGGAFEVHEHEKKVATLLPNCGGRTIKDYANLIWFTEQVCCADMLVSCIRSYRQPSIIIIYYIYIYIYIYTVHMVHIHGTWHGASVSALSKKTYWSSWPDELCPALQPSDARLRTYTGELMSVHGCIIVSVSYRQQQKELSRLVVQGEGPTLLGRDWLKELQLIP